MVFDAIWYKDLSASTSDLKLSIFQWILIYALRVFNTMLARTF